MSKKNLILGGVLVILVAIAFASGPIKEWSKKLGKPENLLSKVDMTQVEKIAIKSAQHDLELEMVKNEFGSSTDVKWRIVGTKDFYIVNDDFIEGLNNAKEAEVEVVSENKEKKGEFSVNEENGTTVKLIKGEEVLCEFVVGKVSSDFVNTYISKSDLDQTYLIKSSINSIFVRDEWYDKIIFAGDKEVLTKVRFQFPTQEFTIEKSEDTWSGILPYNFRVNEEKIQDILDVMSNLKSTEIPAQTFDGTGLEKHLIIVQATGEGIDNVLMVGEAKKDADGKDTELYYAKKGSSDNIYLITKEQRDALNKRIWDIR